MCVYKGIFKGIKEVTEDGIKQLEEEKKDVKVKK